MTKLNQLIAVEKGVKAESMRALTDAHHLVQKTPLLAGIARSYKPKNDDGDTLPPESTKVQIITENVLKSVQNSLTRLFDLTLTKDAANGSAHADIVVDGNVIVSRVPVTTLLFLEKQLTDLHTFMSKLPVLDPSETWTFSETANCYATEETGSVRTKKIPRNHVKAEATDRHPAQVEIFTEDVIVGYWTTIKYSGALPSKRVSELTQRVSKLIAAVKFAREEANGAEITDQKMGESLFSYILND